MCSYAVLLFRGSPSVESGDHSSESNIFSFAVIFFCILDQAQCLTPVRRDQQALFFCP